jgi:Glutathione S-transferase, N-terminal domain
MLRLHDYAGSGNCYKVRLLLAQLDRPYERVPVDIFGGDTLTDDFGRLNPARETPVLETDEGPPLPQSNAILSTWPRAPTSSPTRRPDARRCCAGFSSSRQRSSRG